MRPQGLPCLPQRQAQQWAAIQENQFGSRSTVGGGRGSQPVPTGLGLFASRWPEPGLARAPQWASLPACSRVPKCLDAACNSPGQEGGPSASASVPSITPTKPGAPSVSLPYSIPLHTVHPSHPRCSPPSSCPLSLSFSALSSLCSSCSLLCPTPSPPPSSLFCHPRSSPHVLSPLHCLPRCATLGPQAGLTPHLGLCHSLPCPSSQPPARGPSLNPGEGGAQDPDRMAGGSLEDGVAHPESPPINPQATSVHCSQPLPPQAKCDPTGEGGGETHLRIFAGATPSLWAPHGGQDKQRN